MTLKFCAVVSTTGPNCGQSALSLSKILTEEGPSLLVAMTLPEGTVAQQVLDKTLDVFFTIPGARSQHPEPPAADNLPPAVNTPSSDAEKEITSPDKQGQTIPNQENESLSPSAFLRHVELVLGMTASVHGLGAARRAHHRRLPRR